MRKISLMIALSLALAGCGHQSAPQSAAPLEVTAVTPQSAVMSQGAVLPQNEGAASSDRFAVTLRHDREARLAFRLGGNLAAMPVRVGETLPAGALVAAIDAAPYAAAAARASAGASQAARDAARDNQLVTAGALGSAEAEDAASNARAAAASLAAARSDLSATRLRMPFAGLVAARSAEVGEFVGPGTPVATVVDTASPMIAAADIPAAIAVHIHAGQAATIQLPGHAPLSAHVRRAPGAADPASGMAHVELAIDQPAGLLSGMSGSVTFSPHASANDTLTIPAEALLWARDGQAGVYIIDAHSRAHALTLRCYGLDGDRVRVSGLPANARVITDGAGFAHEGQVVEAGS